MKNCFKINLFVFKCLCYIPVFIYLYIHGCVKKVEQKEIVSGKKTHIKKSCSRVERVKSQATWDISKRHMRKQTRKRR